MKSFLLFFFVMIVALWLLWPTNTICLGDSTLYCRNDVFMDNKGFPSLLKGYVINEGIWGGHFVNMSCTYASKYGDRYFDYVIIRQGFNDLNGMDEAKYENDFVEFISKLNCKNVLIVKWDTADSRTDRLNALLKRVCARSGAIYVDTHLTKGDFLATDDIHYCASGAEKIARAINETVSKIKTDSISK